MSNRLGLAAITSFFVTLSPLQLTGDTVKKKAASSEPQQSSGPETSEGEEAPRALIPQVWVDWNTNRFHAPNCKRITTQMTRLPRSLAKMQKVQPAMECSVTDAEAKRLWAIELKKGVTAKTRAGGVSDRISSTAPSASPAAAASSSPRPVPSRPRVTTTRQEPPVTTYNEVFAASDYFDADRVIAKKCGGEWPNDPRMYMYCVDRQTEAVQTLKRIRPVSADKDRWDAARVRCSREWPDDFRMRVYCEQKAQ